MNARRKAHPDLQVGVLATRTFLAASDTKYNASTSDTLDVTLPPDASGLPSEHESLIGALAASYTGPLSALQDNSNQQDITYLANKTGWDARAGRWQWL